MGYRQIVIARKDLEMGPGKLAAQASHATMKFFTENIVWGARKKKSGNYAISMEIEKGIYEEWIKGDSTTTVCEAKNRNQLLKAKEIAEKLGLEEGFDFFLIKDNCLTELEPEEYENGVGKTLTCIGFRPLPDEIAHQISKKFNLYLG